MTAAPCIRRLSAAEFAAHVPDLAELLVDAVADRASLGFVAPFGPDEAAAWWRSRQAAVACGATAVWVAAAACRVTGTVSLSFDALPNARHRAHVGKLIVHRGARGAGLGRALLTTAEEAAAAAGATLLLLDTRAGGPAEHLYRTAGWTCHGVVPGYAADPGGELQACTFFHKDLRANR